MLGCREQKKGEEKRTNGAENRKRGEENRKKGEENRKRGEENRKMGAENRNCTLGPPYLHGCLVAAHIGWNPLVPRAGDQVGG